MNALQQAYRLGWLSIGLGLPEVATPDRLQRLLRIKRQRGVLQLLGIRELITGGGILSGRAPGTWVWARVAGDIMDLGLLLAALGNNRVQRSRIAGAAGVVLAITMVDLGCARRLRAP